MKYMPMILVVFVLAASAQARPTATPPGGTIDPVNGVAMIGWANDVGADIVIATLKRADCPIAADGPPGDTGDPQQATTQVPEGPPFDPLCLLRPGDHVHLQRWREGQYIDTIGPFYVPVTLWLPVIMQSAPAAAPYPEP